MSSTGDNKRKRASDAAIQAQYAQQPLHPFNGNASVDVHAFNNSPFAHAQRGLPPMAIFNAGAPRIMKQPRGHMEKTGSLPDAQTAAPQHQGRNTSRWEEDATEEPQVHKKRIKVNDGIASAVSTNPKTPKPQASRTAGILDDNAFSSVNVAPLPSENVEKDYQQLDLPTQVGTLLTSATPQGPTANVLTAGLWSAANTNNQDVRAPHNPDSATLYPNRGGQNLQTQDLPTPSTHTPAAVSFPVHVPAPVPAAPPAQTQPQQPTPSLGAAIAFFKNADAPEWTGKIPDQLPSIDSLQAELLGAVMDFSQVYDKTRVIRRILDGTITLYQNAMLELHTAGIGTHKKGKQDPTRHKAASAERAWTFDQRKYHVLSALRHMKKIFQNCIDDWEAVEEEVVLAPKWALDTKIKYISGNDRKAKKEGEQAKDDTAVRGTKNVGTPPDWLRDFAAMIQNNAGPTLNQNNAAPSTNHIGTPGIINHNDYATQTTTAVASTHTMNGAQNEAMDQTQGIALHSPPPAPTPTTPALPPNNGGFSPSFDAGVSQPTAYPNTAQVASNLPFAPLPDHGNGPAYQSDFFQDVYDRLSPTSNNYGNTPTDQSPMLRADNEFGATPPPGSQTAANNFSGNAHNYMPPPGHQLPPAGFDELGLNFLSPAQPVLRQSAATPHTDVDFDLNDGRHLLQQSQNFYGMQYMPGQYGNTIPLQQYQPPQTIDPRLLELPSVQPTQPPYYQQSPYHPMGHNSS